MGEKVYVAKQDTLLEVQKTIGNTTDPAGEESVVALIKNIPEKVPNGAVKSVQRGTLFVYETGKTGKNVNITIARVNPSKCTVSVSALGFVLNDLSGCFAVKSLAETTLSLDVYNTGAQYGLLGEISWEVAEYF